jgi:hypothetical protein
VRTATHPTQCCANAGFLLHQAPEPSGATKNVPQQLGLGLCPAAPQQAQGQQDFPQPAQAQGLSAPAATLTFFAPVLAPVPSHLADAPAPRVPAGFQGGAGADRHWGQ